MAGATTNDREFVLGSQFGGIVRTDLAPSEIDETDGETIYYRWSNRTEIEIIMRKKLTGTVWTTSRALDLWTNRATATYTTIEMGG